jgi:hypothetical protein
MDTYRVKGTVEYSYSCDCPNCLGYHEETDDDTLDVLAESEDEALEKALETWFLTMRYSDHDIYEYDWRDGVKVVVLTPDYVLRELKVPSLFDMEDGNNA